MLDARERAVLSARAQAGVACDDFPRQVVAFLRLDSNCPGSS